MIRDSQNGKASGAQRRAVTPSMIARKSSESANSRANSLRQRAGNQAVQRLMGERLGAGRPCGAAPLGSLPIQAKLTVSVPGDAHELEADRVADMVMRMPESASTPSNTPRVTPASAGAGVQRFCTECEEDSKAPNVQRKESAAGSPQVTSAVAANVSALRGGGSPLPASTRNFFEPRFGADFSQVRLHTDARAADTAKSINAKAFTVGRDIAFGAGQYAPESSEGQRLLAHELTHVVQQNGEQMQRAATDVIQRDVGVEFQAHNVISQNKGKKTFGRTQTKSKPLKRVGGLSMEVDTGSVMEFGTGHYKLWSKLEKDLDAVTAIITDIKGLPQEALDPAKPVTSKNPLVFRGFKTDYGKVDVTVESGDFRGKPQTNEDTVLSDFGSLLRENDSDAATVTALAKGVVGKGATANLTSFMQIIISHLQALQDDDPELVITRGGKVKQPKAFLLLLNKTDYTAMFQSLTASEQKEFTKLVNADPNPIADTAGASMKDDLFKVGYWGWHPDIDGMRVLIKKGRIVRIQKHISGVKGKGANKDIHTCGKTGVPARFCKTNRPIEQVTVGAWLKSMIKPSTRTKKSVSAPLPTYSGDPKAGFSWGLKNTKPGTVLLEVRDHPGMAIAKWLDFVEKRFNIAANCRPGSNLTYDGKKPKPVCP